MATGQAGATGHTGGTAAQHGSHRDISASDALRRIFAQIPKEAPDSEILLDRNGVHLTVGALRELFGDEDVGKYNPHTQEYEHGATGASSGVVSGTQRRA